MLKIVVTDYTFENLDIEKKILEPLGCEVIGQQCQSQEELISLVADADYVITQYARISAPVIDFMKKSKIIVRYGIGVDNVDLDAAAKRGIPVCNVPDYCIDEVADHTLAMILALTRQLFYIAGQVRKGSWKFPVDLSRMYVLKHLTTGVVGFGRIGREVAKRLTAFKSKILVFDPMVDPSEIKKAACQRVSLDELFATSDLITLHCPSNSRTRYLINQESITKMKRGVLIVNLSRGDLIRMQDLIATLENGDVAGAALDVTDPEPINPDSPLLRMDNVIITNHIASVSVSAVKRLRESAAHAVVCAIRGEELPNVVNNVSK